MTSARAPAAKLVSVSVGVLVVVGVLAALARYLLPHELHLAIATPLYGSYAPEQLPVLAAHPVSEALHRLGGALYMILGVLQLDARLRARRPAVHRWAGRLFLLLSVAAGGSGIYMGLAFPYQPGETIPSTLAGGLMILFAIKAYVHVRRREIAAHREWILRSFSLGLGIATIRVLAVIVLNTTSLTTREIIAPTFWVGWGVTLLGAELWIRATRPLRPAAQIAAGAKPPAQPARAG